MNTAGNKHESKTSSLLQMSVTEETFICVLEGISHQQQEVILMECLLCIRQPSLGYPTWAKARAYSRCWISIYSAGSLWLVSRALLSALWSILSSGSGDLPSSLCDQHGSQHREGGTSQGSVIQTTVRLGKVFASHPFCRKPFSSFPAIL